MFKKVLMFFMIAMMSLVLCSCGEEEKPTTAHKNEKTENETKNTGEQDSGQTANGKVEDAETAEGSGNDAENGEEANSDEKEVNEEEAKPHTTNYEESEITEKVKVVVDGKEVTPTGDQNQEMETIIHDGVVYLPVKTIADATGKAYYWDGPEYTVYLGDMEGALEYPTVKLESMTSVNQSVVSIERLTDNYGNKYGRAIYNDENNTSFEYLLNMKYSKFKGTLYIPAGETASNKVYLKVIADGKDIYTSPEMTRVSAPVEVDVNVTGYNDVKIIFSDYSYDPNDVEYRLKVCLADAGFYQ